MFIRQAEALGLLVHDVETNILRDFSLPVRKILVQQVVQELSEPSRAAKTLISPAHVVWALETCGQGFALPIEDEEVIVKVISLYRQWTLEPKGKRPAPIDDNPQFFLQKMIQNFSVMFEPRASTKVEVEKHARLCSEVLDIFASIGRQIGSSLSVETWEIFLKLLIAVADAVLGPNAPSKQAEMQRKLCPQILKVLFELWLLSRTRNPDLWGALKTSVKGWTHHMSLILTWKVTCFALTKRSTAILYGSSEGSEAVVIKIDDSVQTLNLEDEYVFYSWHRMLNIIGNPSEVIQHPAIFLAFMNGVEILVNQYLKIGIGHSNGRFLPPDGNTVLHIFGTWLFDAIQFDRQGFDEGTALAMKILCNTVISKSSTDFLPVYIASFYSCVQEALLKEGRVLLAAITSATGIFTLEIRGVRCLVPSFIYAIHKVITKRAKPFDNVMPAEHVRRACLTILSTILPLPNHFGATGFKTAIGDPAAKAFDVKQYSDLKAHCSMVLSEALSNETYPPNLEILLNLSYTWALEELSHSSEFLKQAVSLIVRKTTSSSGWPAEVALVAIKILSAMSTMYPRLETGEDQANVIVSNLCKYVSGLLSAGQQQATEDLVVHSFRCIADWIMVDQWVVSATDTKHMLLHALVLGLTGRPQRQESVPEPAPKAAIETSGKSKKAQKKEQKKEQEKKEQERKEPVLPQISENIREAAQFALAMLLNQTGNFPTASGPSMVSTLATEEEILLEIIESSNGAVDEDSVKQYLRYYVTTDNNIICAIDRVGDHEPCACLLTRNRYGRYAWDVQLTYVPTRPQVGKEPIDHDQPLTVSSSPFTGSVGEKSGSDLSAVLGFLETAETKAAYGVIEQHVQKEASVLQDSTFGLSHDVAVTIPQPSDPYAGECKFQQSRMLLSHMGFLAMESRTSIFPCNMSQEFFNHLRMLDQLPERECVKVGVVFVRKGQTEEDFFSNVSGTLDFQEMVTSLGWGVNMELHTGFQGTLDKNLQEGEVSTAPYWSNYNTEMLFHVAPLMSASLSSSEKRRQVTNVYSMIVWVESMAGFSPQMIWKKVRHNVVLIVISPLPNGLYHVKLFSKDDISGIGPIIDDSLLSKDVLGHLARTTALNAHRKENHDSKTPQQHRDQCLREIFSRFKVDCTLENFYQSQFTALPSDQISPLMVESSQTASKYHGGPPKKAAKSSNNVAPSSAPAPAAAAPPGSSLSRKDKGGSFSRITPSAGKREGTSSAGSWLTMGARAGSQSSSIGGQHRRAGEDEEEPKSSKKKKKDKTSKIKVKSKKKGEDED